MTSASALDAVAKREAKPTIPPRKDAVLWEEDNDEAPHPRDETLRRIGEI